MSVNSNLSEMFRQNMIDWQSYENLRLELKVCSHHGEGGGVGGSGDGRSSEFWKGHVPPRVCSPKSGVSPEYKTFCTRLFHNNVMCVSRLIWFK